MKHRSYRYTIVSLTVHLRLPKYYRLFLCVQRIPSESLPSLTQLWFHHTIVIFVIIWQILRQEDTSVIDTTSKFSFGMKWVHGSLLTSAFAALLLFQQAVPLRCSSKLALRSQLGCKQMNSGIRSWWRQQELKHTVMILSRALLLQMHRFLHRMKSASCLGWPSS